MHKHESKTGHLYVQKEVHRPNADGFTLFFWPMFLIDTDIDPSDQEQKMLDEIIFVPQINTRSLLILIIKT